MADLFERARGALRPYLEEIQAALRAQEAPLEEGESTSQSLLDTLRNIEIPPVEGGEDEMLPEEEFYLTPQIDDSEEVRPLPDMGERNPARADGDVLKWYASQMAAKRAASPMKFEVSPSGLLAMPNLGHGKRNDILTRDAYESAAPVIQNFWAPYVRELLQKAKSPSPETMRLIEDQMYDAFSSPSQYYGKPSGREIA